MSIRLADVALHQVWVGHTKLFRDESFTGNRAVPQSGGKNASNANLCPMQTDRASMLRLTHVQHMADRMFNAGWAARC